MPAEFPNFDAPDLPRQRMLQFFREQYMSRYKELLPQYYQSLAGKEKKT